MKLILKIIRIKIEDFDINNILIDEKILMYNIKHKRLIDSKPLSIRMAEIDRFLEFMMKLAIQYCLEMKNMITFRRGLDIS